MTHSFNTPSELDFETLKKYAENFCRRFGFDSEQEVNESTSINDIPLKIADMYIKRGYFLVGDVEKPAIYYGMPEQLAESCEVYTGDYAYPKFTITAKNFTEMVENDAFQAVWDFAIAREFVAQDNSLTFSAPSCGFGYVEPKGDDSYPHEYYAIDGQVYHIDGFDGYDDPANYWHEQIFATLVNDGIQPPLIYDGDYRKVIEYNLDFASDIDKTEVINAIMAEAVPAASSLAFRRPTADPNNFYTFEFVLHATTTGTWTQMPVLPRLTAEEEED